MPAGFPLVELLRALPHPTRFRRPNLERALKALGESPDSIDVAGAALGNSYDAISALVREGCLPDLLPTDAQENLAQRLGVTFLDRNIILANRDQVAGFLGMARGVSAAEAPMPSEGEASYPLFAHQRRAIAALRPLVYGQQRRALVHMPTGAGKTRTTMSFCCEHLRTHEGSAILWLASTKELCEQATLEFHRAWAHLGNRDVPILAAWGGRSWIPDQVEDGMLVATPQTLYQRKRSEGPEYLSALGRRISLIVFDEAHQAIAETYRDVTEHLAITGADARDTPIIGLSATPGRTFQGSDKDEELAAFFGRRKVTLDTGPEGVNNPVRYLIDEGYLADPTFELLNAPEGYSSASATFDAEDDEPIKMDPVDYLALVTGAVRDLIRQGHVRIIVFAASVELADDLAAILRSLRIMADSVHGETPTEMRGAAIERYRTRTQHPGVLVNYGVLTTGFDAPQTSGAVIARPTRSLVLYSQMVGRAIRGPKAGGNPAATVITVVDPEVPAFGDIAAAFTHWEDLW